MTKASKPGPQRPGADNKKGSEPKKPGASAAGGVTPKTPAGAAGGVTPKTPAGSTGTVQSDANKNKQSGQGRKPPVGGTAVQGAKSTQPREVKAASPQQQQAESYNREMRRRMEHMGMNPSAENPAVTRREKRLKKLRAKKEERREEVKKTVVTKGPSTDIRLGRRNTYFLVGTIAVVVLIIVVALIIRHPF